MTVILSGAAVLLAGVIISLFALRFWGQRQAIPFLVSHTRKLSDEAYRSMEQACEERLSMGSTLIVLSLRDRLSIFHNSSLNLRIADRATLAMRTDRDLAQMFANLQEDHRKVRWMLILSPLEWIIGKLGLDALTIYSRAILVTYAEELELLSLVSEKCGPTERAAIQAIL
jgi:hypothetical protein